MSARNWEMGDNISFSSKFRSAECVYWHWALCLPHDAHCWRACDVSHWIMNFLAWHQEAPPVKHTVALKFGTGLESLAYMMTLSHRSLLHAQGMGALLPNTAQHGLLQMTVNSTSTGDLGRLEFLEKVERHRYIIVERRGRLADSKILEYLHYYPCLGSNIRDIRSSCCKMTDSDMENSMWQFWRAAKEIAPHLSNQDD